MNINQQQTAVDDSKLGMILLLFSFDIVTSFSMVFSLTTASPYLHISL